MKKLIALVTLTALVLSLSACATTAAPAAGESIVRLRSENTDSITVSGRAGLEATPDVARITVGVTTRASTPVAARQANAEAINATLDALKELGIEEKDIQTSNMNMWNTYGDYGTVTGYRMNTDLTILVREIDKAGEAVDAAISAGSNELNGVEYLVSNRDELYNEALTNAVELARQKAEALAAASGKTLGMVKEVSETSQAATTIFNALMEDANADFGSADDARYKTAIQPGSTTIEAQVKVVFALVEPAAA